LRWEVWRSLPGWFSELVFRTRWAFQSPGQLDDARIGLFASQHIYENMVAAVSQSGVQLMQVSNDPALLLRAISPIGRGGLLLSPLSVDALSAGIVSW
jgi:hypothetical protein